MVSDMDSAAALQLPLRTCHFWYSEIGREHVLDDSISPSLKATPALGPQLHTENLLLASNVTNLSANSTPSIAWPSALRNPSRDPLRYLNPSPKLLSGAPRVLGRDGGAT